MKTLVIYKTLIEGSQHWQKFDNPDDAYSFIHKRSFLNSVCSYQVYYRLDADEKIIPIKLKSEKKSKIVKEFQTEMSKNPKVENKLVTEPINDEDDNKPAIDFKEPEVPPNKIKDTTMKKALSEITNEDSFPYKSGASRDGTRKTKSGKLYSFSEEYGSIEDEKTRTTNRYEIDYSFSKHSDFHQSFIVSDNNKAAINKAMGIIDTSPSVLIRVYNLDKKGNKSNLLYSYDFKGTNINGY